MAPDPMASLTPITTEPIETDVLEDAVSSPASGAVVLFRGVVRNHDGGREILSLDYQAHPEAGKILADCCRRVARETGLAIVAVHRVGSLQIGDTALAAAAAAAHRREAFEACARAVEEIKTTVPIWKRQYFPDGASEWVGL